MNLIYNGTYVGSPTRIGSVIFINEDRNFTNKPNKIIIPIGVNIHNFDETTYNNTISVLKKGIICMEHKLTKQQRRNVSIGHILYWNWKTQKINLKKNKNNTRLGVLLSSLDLTGFCKVQICL